MKDNVQVSITLLHSASHFPGDRVKGQVSVISTITARMTNLRLVWRGVVTTEMNTTRDENTLFREVWYLDPKGTETFVLIPAPSNPHQIKVKKGIKDYSFDVYLKRNIPSSFEMNETVSSAKVEYMLEAWADVVGSPNPKCERMYVPVLATPHHSEADTEEQQTHDATYIVTIPEVDDKEYKTAARITVPCKVTQRGVVLPIVAHIWYDRDCTPDGKVTLSLLQMTTISCHHRQETLIREVETTTLDLELEHQPEYSVQILSESLRIPSSTLPSIDQSIGRLIMIEYRISLKVTIHDNAIYRLSVDGGIEPNMLVELPLTIDSNEIHDSVRPLSTSSRTSSIHSTNRNITVSNRVRSMFRRRSNNLSRQTTFVNSRITISDSSVDDRLEKQPSRRSSSPSISSITTNSLPTKPIPPPFTPITEEQERIKRSNVKSTPIPNLDTGVYTFLIFEDESDDEYVPIEQEKKPLSPPLSSSSSTPPPVSSPQKETPTMRPPPVTIPDIRRSPRDSSSPPQYWRGVFGDQDLDNGNTNRRKNEPKSLSTAIVVTKPDTSPTPSPPGSGALEQHLHESPSPQYTETTNAKLDFISESDTDEHSDDSDDEPDLLSVVARREQRIERQKMRTIPSA